MCWWGLTCCVQAQPPVGTITYALAGAAQPVPTLTQWGVLLLSLLLAPLAVALLVIAGVPTPWAR